MPDELDVLLDRLAAADLSSSDVVVRLHGQLGPIGIDHDGRGGSVGCAGQVGQ